MRTLLLLRVLLPDPWDVPAGLDQRCGRFHPTKPQHQFRDPIPNVRRGRPAGPLQAWLCFLVSRGTSISSWTLSRSHSGRENSASFMFNLRLIRSNTTKPHRLTEPAQRGQATDEISVSIPNKVQVQAVKLNGRPKPENGSLHWKLYRRATAFN
jgi:hypothetical protein